MPGAMGFLRDLQGDKTLDYSVGASRLEIFLCFLFYFSCTDMVAIYAEICTSHSQ